MLNLPYSSSKESLCYLKNDLYASSLNEKKKLNVALFPILHKNPAGFLYRKMLPIVIFNTLHYIFQFNHILSHPRTVRIRAFFFLSFSLLLPFLLLLFFKSHLNITISVLSQHFPF